MNTSKEKTWNWFWENIFSAYVVIAGVTATIIVMLEAVPVLHKN